MYSVSTWKKITLTVCLAVSFAFGASSQIATQSGSVRDSGELPTLYIIGDSTANNNANGARGWGDFLSSHFDSHRIKVLNRARAGRSSRTFFSEGLWDKVLQELKAGDFVLIQFGHNDGGPLDTGRARGSLPGIGTESKEITLADGRKEIVHTFGWYLRRYLADTRAKGAVPIILSLTVRNIWKEGKVERGSGRFGTWAREVARAEDVRFVDLTNLIADDYEKQGQEKVALLFAGDHTHTSPAGAELNASMVVRGLSALRECTLCQFLKQSSPARQ